MCIETTVPLVGVVDDDESVRESLSRLMRSAGYRTALFASADAFLNSEQIRHGNEIVLLVDIQMPGLSGLELQRRLCDSQSPIPVIFLTANDDKEIRAAALRQGAFAFLAKPCNDFAILSAISSAIEAFSERR